MIDSVLKGNGNSRFLKSAVPAGTSWADALAMLQAGTFPIDFNGINTEGFQQVGTPLNKANLLKDATAAQIGLPPSTTPDGMFQALGNTGELHVWRKTVIYNQPVPEVPGSYTLGTAQSLHIATRTSSNSNRTSNITGVLASNEVTVDISGEVSLKDPATITFYPQASQTDTRSGLLSGYSYFMFPSSTVSSNNCAVAAPTDKIYYVASNVEFKGCGTYTYGETAVISAAQLVTGVPGTPAIPAETATTYPVSTNPNAYQEGDDAKEAGYTLGEVKTGKHILSYQHSDLNEIHWEYSSKITVSDDGTVSLVSPSSEDIDGGDYTSVAENLIGKFARPTEDHSGFRTNVIVFFPSDATVTRDTTYGYNAMTISKYQPVTGYAAIPAGTTIEYLGKLGDKARVQVVSYVGTGTSGDGNETKIPVSFPPELLIIALKDTTRRTVYISVPRSDTGLYLSADGSSSIYGERAATVSYVDGKVHIVCSDSFGQMNASGYAYIAVALS